MSTFYVDTATGNDSDNGTSLALAKLTIKAGVALASAGDIVEIVAGTYTGANNVIDTQTGTVGSGTSYVSPITIRAYQGGVVTIRPPDNTSAVRLASSGRSYIVFQDLIFDGVTNTDFSPSGPSGVYLSDGTHHIRFIDCETKNWPNFGNVISRNNGAAHHIEWLGGSVHDCGDASGDNTNGHAFYISGYDNVVDGTEIADNLGYGIHAYDDAGPLQVSRNQISGCSIHDNGRITETSFAILFAYGQDNVAQNNLIYGNRGGIQNMVSATGSLLAHNVLYDNADYGIELGASDALVTNCIVYSNGTGITHDGSATLLTNRLTNPLFTNAGAADFTLQDPASPCINAGTLLVSVTDDYDGNARPFGVAPDQGAYETGSLSPPPPDPDDEDEDPDEEEEPLPPGEETEPAPLMAMKPFAEVDLNDRITYYGGYKAPWVLSWHLISRGCSDRAGQIEHMTFGARLSDTTRYFRGRLGVEATRYLTNKPLVERMIDDEERRREGLPRVVANGYVSDYSPEADLQFDLTGTDWLKKKFSRKRRAQQSWQPHIDQSEFPECPPEAVNIPCPIVLGPMSDTRIVTTQIGTTLPFDPSFPRALNVGARDREAAGTLFGTVTVIVVATDGAAEGPISHAAGTNHYSLHAVQVGWDAVGSYSYNIYFFNGKWLDWTPHGGLRAGSPVTWVRKLTHNNTPDAGWAGRDMTVILEDITDGTDALTGVATSSVDQGHGLVKPIYVGIEGIGSPPELHHVGLVSRCAMKAIPALYLDGIAQDIDTDDTWKVPGHAPWNALFSDPYEDRNGQRFTVIYGKAGYEGPDRMAGLTQEETVANVTPSPFAVGVTLSVLGIEENGDGSGDLISSGPEQALWFVNNFIAPEPIYQSGQYLVAADTQFPHMVGLTLVDEDTFAVVQDATAERINTGSPGTGYEGAGIIGANGEFLSAIEVLSWFAVSYDFDWIWTRKGQLAISIEPVVPVSGVTAIDDVISIVDRSFRIEDKVGSDFFNIHPYVYTRDYAGQTPTGWWVNGEVRDAASIINYDQTREAPLWEFHFLRRETYAGAATLSDVIQRKRARFRHPRRRANLRVPLSGLVRELGEAVPITHIEGIGAAGWVNHQVRIVRDELDPNDNTVVLECYDLETVFEE